MIDFFVDDHSEPTREDLRFGLCDDGNQEPAYSNVDSPKTWQATVENEQKLPVQFRSIDKRIKIHNERGDEESTCDGMLLFLEQIYLVELKCQQKNWQQKAIKQLMNTIKLIKQHNAEKLEQFTNKKAFACNRKHPNFAVIETATKKNFVMKDSF